LACCIVRKEPQLHPNFYPKPETEPHKNVCTFISVVKNCKLAKNHVLHLFLFLIANIVLATGAEEYEEAWQMYPAHETDRVPCCIVTEGAWTWFGCIVFTLALLGTEAAQLAFVSIHVIFI
jgi:hypothetical protein